MYTTSSLETAKCLVDLIARFGIMRRIVSDRGTAFTAKTFREVARILGVHHKLISSLNPQANGRAEKQVGLIKAQLKLICETDDQIVEKLPLVLLGMRGIVSSTTKVSPFHAIMGRPMALPIIGCDPDTPSQPAEQLRIAEKAYLDKLRAQLDDLENRVKQNIAEEKAEVKRAYDRRFRTQPTSFKLGDLVWLKHRGVKAHSPSVITAKGWIGPFFITSIPPSREGEGVAYFLTHSVTGKRFKHPVPGHRLKPCTTDRTELMQKYPNLDLQKSNTETLATHTKNDRQTAGPTVKDTQTTLHETETLDKAKQTGSDKPSSAYCQAKAITRQRFAPDGVEFLVKFNDNMLEWVHHSQVSPALKADYMIKKHDRRNYRKFV